MCQVVYESIDIQAKRSETVVVDSAEERLVFVWNEKEGRVQRRVESIPATETVAPLSVEHREEETVTEIPYVMKMYPSGRIEVPSWMRKATAFQVAVSLAYERRMTCSCFLICVLLSVSYVFLH